MSEDNRLYATPEATESMGAIKTYVPELTNNIDFLYITKKDLLKYAAQAGGPQEEGEINILKKGMAAMFNDFAKNKGLHDLDKISEENRSEICAYAQDQAAAYFGYDHDLDGKTNLGIVIGAEELTPAQSTAGRTGFPERLITKPFGTKEEHDFFRKAHEFAHIGQGFMGMTLVGEIDADRKANNTIMQAATDGHAIRAEFVQEIIDERLVGSLGVPGADMDFTLKMAGVSEILQTFKVDEATHTTHFALNTGKEASGLPSLSPDSGFSEQQLQGMVTANTMINGLLGIHEIQNIIKEYKETDEFSQRSKDLMEGRDVVSLIFPETALDIGAKISAENPVRACAAGKALVEKGVLPVNTPAGEYISRVHSFFEKRGDQLTGDPEYVAAKAEYTALLDQAGPLPVARNAENLTPAAGSEAGIQMKP